MYESIWHTCVDVYMHVNISLYVICVHEWCVNICIKAHICMCPYVSSNMLVYMWTCIYINVYEYICISCVHG